MAELVPYDALVKEAVIRGLLRRVMSAGKAARRTKGLRVPKAFAEGVKAPDVERAWRGYRSQAMRGGDESLLMWPVRALARKALGTKRVEKGVWDYISGPALAADTAVGKQLEKIPLVGKKLFRVKDKIPWGKGLHREVERPSALAPLTKARDIAEPLIVGVGLEKGIKKLVPKKNSPESADQQGDDMQDHRPNVKAASAKGVGDRDLHEKVASVMLHLHEKNKEHEKRAHAIRFLYKQAELGYAQMPQSYSELEEKLASLVTQDLVVLDKALELAGGNVKLGELGVNDPKSSRSAAEQFQAAVLGDDL